MAADVKSQRAGTPMLVLRPSRRLRAARTMVANKPGAPGRLRISVKTIAQGRPGVSRLHLWYLPPAFFRRRAAGVSRRLAFPAPSD
ncbi:hypothetical protein BRADO4315 [Bradyrhizobium sp. ORS 278]|nr:hypothetical protein BRADO4315 [Bradyrhizobium sp. ORS 278]